LNNSKQNTEKDEEMLKMKNLAKLIQTQSLLQPKEKKKKEKNKRKNKMKLHAHNT